MKPILLITPAFTQLNTPYPATAYLKGFLNSKEIPSHQVDLGIEVILELFSKKGLEDLFSMAVMDINASLNAQRIFALRNSYITTIDAVILFLQGNNPSLAWQICNGNFLPQAARFESTSDLDWAFGAMGMQDKAKHLATLYLEDLSDFIVECIDPHFGFSRYAERLGRSANSFDELYNELQKETGFLDELSFKVLKKKMDAHQPSMVCISVPFPGNLYNGLRCAQYLRAHHKDTTIATGGGFVNTELRSLTDVRLFEFIHYLTFDDGELPLELLIKHENSDTDFDQKPLKRTMALFNGKVSYNNKSSDWDYKQTHVGTPDYEGLPLNKYISVIEMANPMHSLWSDGKWIKLTMAHGCYWGNCTFCDVSLNYINQHDPNLPSVLVDKMEALMAQTGQRGFHFVDEAAPPALMRALALEIIRRKLSLTWWTNIRFEKSFTKDLCLLLKKSGCIAVSGGLEVASDRLLRLINKGVSLEQVASTSRNFTECGIMVHAYLMYGFPSQTVQETVDSLEVVRQLFELGLVQSGFWHQFALTAHSPVGLSPQKFNITPHYAKISFANNDIAFTDNTGIDHDKFSYGLKKSLYNYMHGVGFDFPLHKWFPASDLGFKIPKTSIKPTFIQSMLQKPDAFYTKPSARILWMGEELSGKQITKSKKGESIALLQLSIHEQDKSLQISLPHEQGIWLLNMLKELKPDGVKAYTFEKLKVEFEKEFDHFELFWYSKPISKLKKAGLIAV